jgi:hypothetical protein
VSFTSVQSVDPILRTAFAWRGARYGKPDIIFSQHFNVSVSTAVSANHIPSGLLLKALLKIANTPKHLCFFIAHDWLMA